jgi:DNA invertase Pin-like site-specific DNA recombinase
MATRRKRPSPVVGQPLRVVLYRRVSTDEQAADGHGLAAQHATLRAEVDRRGWSVVADLEDGGVSGGRPLSRRPAGAQALQLLAAGDADALVVAKADRLSRSLVDLAGLMDLSRSEGWALVLLDLGVDVTTPAGELAASVVGAAAQYERRMVGQRTREGLAAARAKGVRLGRPQQLPLDVVARIVDERRVGQSLPGIARGLMAEGVPTARGGATWHPSTVAAVLESQAAAALA